jgi:hypothetical protein
MLTRKQYRSRSVNFEEQNRVEYGDSDEESLKNSEKVVNTSVIHDNLE